MNVNETLKKYADTYETADFINGDPSWFMHQVSGTRNQEAMAFLAQSISYGSRKQFLPKIQWMLDRADGDADNWVRTGAFRRDVADDSGRCFYRLYTCHDMHRFLSAYQQLLNAHGSLGEYVSRAATDAKSAITAICQWFAAHDGGPAIPLDAKSACKRLCMFLRWMVRSHSPVDLGLWAHIIPRQTLIMPLDTHVLQQSLQLGLLSSKSASMHTAELLTKRLAEVFPDDPLRGDFALFGYGVSGGAGVDSL